MVLFGLLLSLSSGIFLEDMSFYYDTQYPKLRSAYERADNSYCQMTKDQCVASARNGVAAPVMSDGEIIKDGNDQEIWMPYDELWPAMYAEAAREASKDSVDYGCIGSTEDNIDDPTCWPPAQCVKQSPAIIARSALRPNAN